MQLQFLPEKPIFGRKSNFWPNCSILSSRDLYFNCFGEKGAATFKFLEKGYFWIENVIFGSYKKTEKVWWAQKGKGRTRVWLVGIIVQAAALPRARLSHRCSSSVIDCFFKNQFDQFLGEKNTNCSFKQISNPVFLLPFPILPPQNVSKVALSC